MKKVNKTQKIKLLLLSLVVAIGLLVFVLTKKEEATVNLQEVYNECMQEANNKTDELKCYDRFQFHTDFETSDDKKQ